MANTATTALAAGARTKTNEMYELMDQAALTDDPGKMIELSVKAQQASTLASIMTDMASKGEKTMKDCCDAAYQNI